MSRALLVLSAFVLTSVVSAQVAPGFRLFGPHGTDETYLLDVNGNVVHTWPSGYVPGNGIYLLENGDLIRAVQLPGGPGIGGSGGGVQRIKFDGTIVWDFDFTTGGVYHHHDVEPMPNGNLLLIAWDTLTTADAIANGRDPALVTGPNFWPDAIYEIEQTGPTTGSIVWEWHVWDHLIQDFDNTKPNFGVVADNPQLLDINYPPNVVNDGDWNHANSISYDPVHDLILINFPFQNEFYVIDHSTTIAEAAGHTGGTYGKGGDFLYRWGNEEAYGKGGPADKQLFNPHGTAFIPAGRPGGGNVIVFNNQFGGNFSAVHEIELPLTPGVGFTLGGDGTYGPAAPVWEYTAPNPTDLFSPFLSNAERLPNGNTLIDSGFQGWFQEVTNAKVQVWEHFNTLPTSTSFVFQISYYERSLWADADSVSVAAGGTVGFDLVAGSPHDGELYFLLGSASGTDVGVTYGGQTIPLNFDPYFFYTLTHPNSALLPGSFGTLDTLGKSTASLVLPAGAAAPLVGTTLNHAYATLDPVTLNVIHTSNAVPLELTP